MAITEKAGTPASPKIRLAPMPTLPSLPPQEQAALEAWWRDIKRVLEANIVDSKLSGET